MGYMALRKQKKRENFLFSFFLIVLTILSVLPFAEKLKKASFFAEEFRFQYFLIAAIIFILSLFKKRLTSSLVSLALIILNLSIIASHINFFDNQKVKPVSENSLNFVVYHSSKDNTSTNNLIFDNLKKQKKDFIFIIDAPKDLTNYIEQSSNPFSVKQINCFKDTQCVILSRFDAVDSGEFELSDSNKALWASYSYNNKMFTTLLLNEGTFSSKYFNKNKSITRLIDFIKSRDEPVILIGGFNSVPWSKRFKSLETEASLFSKSGLEPNWPSVLPLPLRLPLDHIYAHPGINLFNVGLQAIPDSNYRAISGTLSIPK